MHCESYLDFLSALFEQKCMVAEDLKLSILTNAKEKEMWKGCDSFKQVHGEIVLVFQGHWSK